MEAVARGTPAAHDDLKGDDCDHIGLGFMIYELPGAVGATGHADAWQ
jgi:hypothetical protein